MHRRQYVAALAALCPVIAGCSGEEGSSTETATATATATPTRTSTPTRTGTATPTATPAPAGPTSHAVGERFVVGEGREAFAYTVHRFLRADRLGQAGWQARGVFVIADVTVENLTGTKDAVPVESFVLRGGVLRRVDQGMTKSAETDPRLDLPSLADVTVFPGKPVRGMIVYETPRDPANDLYLRITPPADANDEAAHVVPIGPFDTITPLE